MFVKKTMELQSNPQLELAFDFVSYTNKNIFLTGKAGTGKTTFLQRIKTEPVKRMAVVAPTGVAAINAGGMTIHSFFQLPFGPYLPGNSRDAARQRKFSREKIRLIQSLDLLVIDEISMVRADLLDGIDDVLRRYKNHYQPFGGVQLLMIGDLHQLPPVVKEEEWGMLRSYYQTPYFFSSQALQQTQPVVIELKHIYRQSDSTFIELLNKVRDNKMDAEVLETLNSRYVAGFQPGEEEGYITLTTHNASAHEINAQKLADTPGDLLRFSAKISGDFPTHAFPTDETLELKTGAQVMFVKNDISPEKRFYNGKIGRITRIGKDEIIVQCPDDEDAITVTTTDWNNVKYALNEGTKEVTETVIGSFVQFPLRLAWAITIHKSQGLTFERAIIDAQAAFAHGQVYVALSRCKSFEGIVLRTPIAYSSVKTDSTVRHFSAETEKNAPDEEHLRQSKRAYQESLLMELFDLSGLKRWMEQANRTFLSHEGSLTKDLVRQFQELYVAAEADLFPVAAKFRGQMRSYFPQPEMPEDNAALQERVGKACGWFLEKIGPGLLEAVKKVPVITDNKAVKKVADEAMENLQRELFVKKACLDACLSSFSARTYLRAKADASMDFKPVSPMSAGFAEMHAGASHPELYARLKKWRDEMVQILDVEAYEVMSVKSLIDIAELLPANVTALKKVKGIGDQKAKRFGAQILEIVSRYCVEKGLAGAQLSLPDPEPPKPKINTKQLSYDLFRAGKSVAEIAQERSFTVGTIEGHLSHYIGTGELDISEVIEPAKLNALSAYLKEHYQGELASIKAHFGDAYSFGELRMVVEYLKREG